MTRTWDYTARVLRVIDGDTLRVAIDLGYEITVVRNLRLYGVDTPEIVGKDRARGLAAKRWMEALLPAGSVIYYRSIRDKRDKYGRYLADILIEGKPLAELMIEEGVGTRI